MNSINWTLCFAAFAVVASFSARSSAQEEPIPDFGPSGPEGIENRGLRGGGLPPANLDQRDRSMAQRRGIQLQMPNLRQALQRMDLPDEQRNEIRSIFARYADDGKVIRENLSVARETLKAAQEADPRDPTAIKAAKDAVDSQMKKMAVLQAEVRSSTLNVLTLEQEDNLYKRVEIMRKRDEGRTSDKANP